MSHDMLCSFVLYCTVLCCVMLCFSVFFCTARSHVVVVCCVVLYCDVLLCVYCDSLPPPLTPAVPVFSSRSLLPSLPPSLSVCLSVYVYV